MIQFHSAAPMAQVVAEPPGEPVSFVRGRSARTTWRLHNVGDAPATIRDSVRGRMGLGPLRAGVDDL